MGRLKTGEERQRKVMALKTRKKQIKSFRVQLAKQETTDGK